MMPGARLAVAFRRGCGWMVAVNVSQSPTYCLHWGGYHIPLDLGPLS